MKHRKHRGFALVVTLTLLVILTVIAVAMLGLSTISLRSNSQGEAMATARANARMSMMLALGELQKELGPDQRISAPGSLELDDKLDLSKEEPAHAHWTGAYKSWASDSWPIDATKAPSWNTNTKKYDVPPLDTKQEILDDQINDPDRFNRWLISGDETLVKDRNLPSKGNLPDPNTDPVLVAKTDAKDGVPARDEIRAWLIPTKRAAGDPAKGGFAWWIGDQNTKAKIGGVVEDAADAKEAAARLQSTPRAGHEIFSGLESVEAKDERLGKLPSTKSLNLLAKDTDFFHDATTTSLGLLTNVRAGGLRKDLNFLLEKPMPAANTAATAPLYTAAASSPSTVKGAQVPFEGINLGELWVDHNIWGELQYGPPAHADGSALPSDAPYLECGPKMLGTIPNPFLNYQHLPRLQLTQLYSLISKEANVGGDNVYELYLVTDPIFTIWNPFDVCLNVPQSNFATLKTWAIPYDLKLTFKEGTPLAKTDYTNSIGNIYNVGGTGNDVFVFQGTLGNVSKTSQNLVMRPGEVQIMAQGFKAPINYSPSGVDFDTTLGWEQASGYAYKIPYQGTDEELFDPENPDKGRQLRAAMDGSQSITFSLTPNDKLSANTALMLWSYMVPDPNPNIGSFNINFHNSWLSGQGDIFANDIRFEGIFPTVPLPTEVSPSKRIKEDLKDAKTPICVFTYGLRTEIDPNAASGTRFTGRSMLRANATSLSQDLFNLDPAVLRTSPLQVGMRLETSLSNIIECDGGLGYYGAGYGSGMGASYVVTRSIPREPIHSLGALQHGAAEGKRFGQAAGEKSWFLQPSVSHAIANSFAPSCLKSKEVRGVFNTDASSTAKWPVADHSYLANLALWDTYFYSSIKPTEPGTSAYQCDLKKNTDAYDQQEGKLARFLGIDPEDYKPVDPEPLPNERMRPWTSDPEAALKAIFPSSTPDTNAADRIASYLMMDGMFNVNSTSVTAWKAFLSGLKKAKVPSNPTPNVKSQPDLVDADGTAVAALLEAAGVEIDDSALGDPTDAEQWRGFRSLSDDQIDELAKAIVKQVRLRGPFLSISDFVNRRPGSDKVLAVSGALQSALDDTDVSINEAYRQGSRSLSLTEAQAKGFPFPEAEAGPKAIGSPGYVKQGDLLTTLGPMINVRGDTFVIRSYGEAREGNNVTARAWCEVTVQRVPDYVDPKDESYVPTKDLTSEANKTFGRRFNIVSFRYLDPREVL